MKINKNILISISVVITIFSISISKQFDSDTTDQYQTESNMLYYEFDSTQIDKYKNERCRLDLYYPKKMPIFQLWCGFMMEDFGEVIASYRRN